MFTVINTDAEGIGLPLLIREEVSTHRTASLNLVMLQNISTGHGALKEATTWYTLPPGMCV